MSLELNENLQAVTDALSDKFSDKLIEVYQSSGDTYFRVEADSIREISAFLKDELHYIYLTDIIGTDRYTSQERFEVIYVLMNLRVQQRIFVKVRVDEEEPVLDTVSGVWSSANWHEREVYDMYGVRFNDHPDHRRIYLPEDFEYFPLRKEFPLLGIPGSIDLPHTTPDTE
jgi:NADH-quinone oxidoreductase subunit C